MHTDRDTRLDILKGIGIILVVFGHMVRGFTDYGFIDDPALYQRIDFALYTTHMPLFFLIAGFNSFGSLRAKTAGEFWTSRIWSTLYPYIIWSFLLWLSKWGLGKVTVVNHPIDSSALFKIFWEPISIFWFLYALFVFQLAAPLVKASPKLFLCAALLLSALGTFFEPSADIAFAIAVNIPFFAIGFFLASREIPLFPSKTSMIMLATAGIAVFCAGCFFAIQAGYEYPVSLYTLPISLAGIVILIALAFAAAVTPLANTLSKIGLVSMPIFVLHVFALPIVPRLFPKIGLESDWAGLFLGTVIGVALSIVGFYILRRLGLADWLALTGKRPTATAVRPNTA